MTDLSSGQIRMIEKNIISYDTETLAYLFERIDTMRIESPFYMALDDIFDFNHNNAAQCCEKLASWIYDRSFETQQMLWAKTANLYKRNEVCLNMSQTSFAQMDTGKLSVPAILIAFWLHNMESNLTVRYHDEPSGFYISLKNEQNVPSSTYRYKFDDDGQREMDLSNDQHRLNDKHRVDVKVTYNNDGIRYNETFLMLPIIPKMLQNAMIGKPISKLINLPGMEDKTVRTIMESGRHHIYVGYAEPHKVSPIWKLCQQQIMPGSTTET